MATRVVTSEARVHEPSELARFLRNVDYLLLAAVAGLVAYGLWVLESVTRTDVPGDPDYYFVRQSINVTLGVVALVAAAAVKLDAFQRSWKALYALLLFLLAIVFVADAIRGSRRWIDLGFFQFQPSEIGKVLMILALAGFLASRARSIGERKTTLAAVGLVAAPAFLVFIEPDFGTTLIYCGILAAALFLAGTRWLHLGVLGAFAVVAALAILWLLPAAGIEVLKPYQQQRLTGFWNPDLDPSGVTYNITQSITAVGSGGLDGRGVAGATQTNLNYLPEHQTDFIFS